jgi:hypothetical protein
MTFEELYRHCRQKQREFGEESSVLLTIPSRRYAKTDRRRLFGTRGGPTGLSVSVGIQGENVYFKARDVLAWLRANVPESWWRLWEEDSP